MRYEKKLQRALLAKHPATNKAIVHHSVYICHCSHVSKFCPAQTSPRRIRRPCVGRVRYKPPRRFTVMKIVKKHMVTTVSEMAARFDFRFTKDGDNQNSSSTFYHSTATIKCRKFYFFHCRTDKPLIYHVGLPTVGHSYPMLSSRWVDESQTRILDPRAIDAPIWRRVWRLVWWWAYSCLMTGMQNKDTIQNRGIHSWQKMFFRPFVVRIPCQ
mmetsp:Transcript_6587/g.13765  ORF Transcript_6587/g.13765 Transcript_6587/m.13765 type:complete len:213 (+) Transcript_6587:556-1194(+)